LYICSSIHRDSMNKSNTAGSSMNFPHVSLLEARAIKRTLFGNKKAELVSGPPILRKKTSPAWDPLCSPALNALVLRTDLSETQVTYTKMFITRQCLTRNPHHLSFSLRWLYQSRAWMKRQESLRLPVLDQSSFLWFA